MTFKRPKADYKPEGNLPNVDEFQRIAHEKKPNSSRLLDALANYIMDALNYLEKKVSEAVVKLLPGADDPDNKDKPVVSDGTTYVFKKLTGINLEAATITEREIKDLSVEREKIQLQAVGTEQLEDGAVTTPKIPNGAVTLPKMRSSGQKCLLMGSTGSNAYTEKVADNNSQPWYVFCNDPNIMTISLNSLATIWNYTPYTFTGIKLTDKTVNLTKLLTEATGGFLISGAGNTGVEILPVLDTDYWKLPVRTLESGGKVTLKGLVEICANYANSIDGGCLRVNTVAGSKVTDGSLPKTKLQNSGQLVVFASGNIDANGSAQKVFNCTSSRLSLGLYKISLSTVAPDTKYIVTFGNEDNGGNYVTNAYVVKGSRTTSSFNVQVWGSGAAAQDEGFNFVVYAF